VTRSLLVASAALIALPASAAHAPGGGGGHPRAAQVPPEEPYAWVMDSGPAAPQKPKKWILLGPGTLLSQIVRAFDLAPEAAPPTPCDDRPSQPPRLDFPATSTTKAIAATFEGCGNIELTIGAKAAPWLRDREGASSGELVALIAEVAAASLTHVQWTSAGDADRHASPDGNVQLLAVSCPADRSCVAIDLDGYASIFDGTSWRAAGRANIADTAEQVDIAGLSCAAESFCVAVDTDGQASVFDGHRWSAPTTIFRSVAGGPRSAPRIGSTSVSCPTATFCMAVNASGADNLWTGSGWQPPPEVRLTAEELLGGGWNSVSCPTSRFCMSADTTGHVREWTGGSWSRPIDVDGAANDWTFAAGGSSPSGQVAPSFGDVDCPSTSTWMALDSSNAFFLRTGSSWQQSQIYGSQAVAISCPSNSFCVAGSESRTFYTWSEGIWSSEEPLIVRPGPVSYNLGTVSCASPQFCMGVDPGGASFVGRRT
jgi:hypothetical protein